MERITTEKYNLFIYLSLDHGLFIIVSNQKAWLQKTKNSLAGTPLSNLTHISLFLSCNNSTLP